MVQTKDFDNEFDNFVINLDRPLGAGTLKAYKSQFLVIRYNFDIPLFEISNKQFLDYLESATTKGGKVLSLNTKKNLLNIMVMVKKQVNEKDYKELYDLREKLRGDVNTAIKDKHEKMDLDSMVKYDELVKFLNIQSNTSYIINYLLLYYCVRNRDLDLTISEYENEIPDSGNHLLIDKDKIIFVRNDYKPKQINVERLKEYLQKTYITKNKKKY